MRESVRKAFYKFNAPMEGEVPYFYQDVKGLVSIGVGLLCDPLHLALHLPMVDLMGRTATEEDITREWNKIKALGHGTFTEGNPAARGGHLYAKPHTTLRLTAEGLERTLLGKLAQVDAFLTKRFPDYEQWPADAQLGTLSLAWACGPAFRFPKLEAALKAGDFTTASIECFMPEEKTISGLRPRNRANRILYENAEIVKNCMYPYETLYWPRELGKEMPEEAITIDERQPVVHAFHEHEDIVYNLDSDSDKPPPEAA